MSLAINSSLRYFKTSISRGLKTVSADSKAKSQAIKRINRENKSLFGKLLETKGDRRKKIINGELPCEETATVVKVKNVGCIEDDKRLQQGLENKTKNLEKISLAKSSNAKLVPSLAPVTHIVKNYFGDDKEKCLPTRIRNLKGVQNNHEIKPESFLPSFKSTKHDDNLEPEITEKPAPVKKTSSTLLLPDSVIQNITSFPMLNVKKAESLEEVNTKTSDLIWKCPSVSKVLNATMSEGSRAVLARWRSKMIAQLGEEGFAQHNKAQLNRGSQFHAMMRNYLSGQPVSEELDPEVEACWSSLSSVVGHVSDVTSLESLVVHTQLLYRGVIDCVANFNGEPMVVEWKKSAKQKSQIQFTYDAPIQLAAYLGAMSFDPTYKIQVKGGVVAVAYSDGSPAEVFRLDLSDITPYWREWLARLQKFWQIQQALQNDAQ